jgi:hypothetical protein
MAGMTRKDLEAAIDEGGAVLHQGVHITRKEDLPTDAELKKLHGPAPFPVSEVSNAPRTPSKAGDKEGDKEK